MAAGRGEGGHPVEQGEHVGLLEVLPQALRQPAGRQLRPETGGEQPRGSGRRPRLGAVADALAGHAEVAYAAATTGPGNLAAMVVRRDADALYEYLARRLGGRQGVLSAEATPVTRHIKRSGALLGPVRSV